MYPDMRHFKIKVVSLPPPPGPQCGFQVEDNDGSCSRSRCLPALRDQQAGRQQRDGELFLKMIEAKRKRGLSADIYIYIYPSHWN